MGQKVSTFRGFLMKKVLAVFLCVLFPAVAFAGDNSYKITYDGGSVPGVKTGTEVKLYLDSDKVRLVKEGEITVVPAAAITEISYGAGRSSESGGSYWHRRLHAGPWGADGTEQVKETLHWPHVG